MDPVQFAILVIQPIILALSTFLAVQFDAAGCTKGMISQIVCHLPHNSQYTSDPSVLVPLFASIILVVFLVCLIIINLFASYFGPRASYRGTYLSLPDGDKELNIFQIGRGFFRWTWRLRGKAYSLQSQREIAHWQSDVLDLPGDRKDKTFGQIRYIYEGVLITKSPADPFTGFANIVLDSDMERGRGYWIDANAQPDKKTMDVTISWYFKLTPEIEKFLSTKLPWYRRRLPGWHLSRTSIVQSVASLSEDGRKAKPFDRST